MVLKNSFARMATALALLAAVVAPRAGAQDSGIAIGEKAPGAAVELLDGSAADLSSVLGKGPVLIEFWATWCPNCKELEPAMLAAQKKYAGKVSFVGIAVSVNQSPRAAQAYAARHGLTTTQFFDRRGKAVGAYDVPATSFVVVVNKAGIVVYTGLGGTQDLDAAIKKAL
ncbi:MAG: TlpA family protein disulfide reductase [Gemmatimonadaceae bacterium]